MTRTRSDGLRVCGREIRYGGKPVMLRGVAVGDPVMGRQGRPLSDYREIADNWNANVVRISIHPGCWTRDPRGVMRALGDDVRAALEAGLFPIIAWHTIGWPDGPYAGQARNDTYDSSVRLAESFWKRVATRFGGDGRVIFELWNEPVIVDPAAKPYIPDPWGVLTPVWERLTAIIRKRGDNLILAAGHDWGYDLRGIRERPLPDANTAYIWHVYAGNSGNDAREWAKRLDGLQRMKPVVVTEWGFQGKTKRLRWSPARFGVPFTRDFLDRRALHSTAWCWHDTWGSIMLKHDWRTPTPFGRFVRDYLRRHGPPARTAGGDRDARGRG